jgi:tRNA A-37 threonylcarbamoyl transferase component Bud32
VKIEQPIFEPDILGRTKNDMAEFPFQLLIKCTSSKNKEESLQCTSLLRAVPGKRATYDAKWKDTNVIVKVFSHKIKARIHLERELNGLKQLQKRGLNSTRALFSGKTDNGNWAVVLEKIVDSATVLDVLAETTDKNKQMDLLRRICRELAKQHSKGVLQKDLHLENFLVSNEQIYSIDPSQMVFLPDQISREKSISQLVLLVLSLPSSDAKLVKIICEEYFRARGWQFGKADEALFRQRLTLEKKRAIKRNLEKSLRTGKRFLRIREGGTIAVFDKDFYRRAEPFDFAEHIDALMDKGQVLKDGNTCYVSRLVWNDQNVVVKRYNHKGFFHSLRHTIKRSRARRGWLHGQRLKMLEVSTPQPLAYIEKLKGFLIWKSYLVTRYVKGKRFYDFMRDDNITQQQRSTTEKQVKNLLAKLKEHRITHGDLKHSNILITENGPVLVDLDGMKVHKFRRIYQNRQTKDLKRFKQE